MRNKITRSKSGSGVVNIKTTWFTYPPHEIHVKKGYTWGMKIHWIQAFPLLHIFINFSNIFFSPSNSSLNSNPIAFYSHSSNTIVGGYISSVAPHYTILLCGSSTRVQCGRSLDNFLCSPQFLVVNRYNNACFVGDRSESVFSTVSPLAIYLGQ
jgi:hypothetical protein